MARLDSNIFPMLSENIITRLHSRNIFTVYDFMLQTCDDLMKKTGLSFKEIESIRESFLDTFGGQVVDPLELCENELINTVSTGIESLDDLLEGGLHRREIYEICGFSSAGKSQLCHWISIYSTLNSSAEVHYVDASRNFSISRIQMILEAKQCSDIDVGKVMSNIKLYQIHKIHEIFTVLHNLSKMNQNEFTGKLLIVDSLSLLCTLIPNVDVNTYLCNFASMCRFFVNHFNATVIVVNTIKLGQSATLDDVVENKFDFSIKPSLGNYWLGVPNVRLLISQLENNKREIIVWKSCQLENGKKCSIVVNDEGIF